MELKVIFPIFFVLTFQVYNASSARILVWQAVGSHSTRISMWSLMESLAEKGHNVTFLSAFDNMDKTNSNVTSITPPKWKAAKGSWEKDQSFFELRKDPLYLPNFFYDIREDGLQACRTLWSDPEFVTWVKTVPKFDLVIMEYAWNECVYSLVHFWNAKLAIYGTTSPLPFMEGAFGFAPEASHVGDMMFTYPTSKKKPLTFVQRFLNEMGPLMYHITREWFYIPEMERISSEGMTQAGLLKGDLPSFLDIERKTAVILLTTHYSFGATRSFPPNVISVGGTVVAKKLKPLPKDMEEFIKTAKNGFVFISFGTVVEFTNFDDDVQIEFIAAIREFPDVKFVWKSTHPIKHPLPDNVFIASWAPQQTLLAHPKIKAFITHAGMGGSYEAIHNAVPTICIPVLADQNLNADLMDEREAGIMLEVLTLKQEELQWAINEILHTDKYRKGMKRLSEIFKDRPRPPLEESIWWIEYALRHDNIHEILLPASAFQPWWKKRQLDVWFTALLMILLILLIPAYLIRLVLKKLILAKKSEPKSKLKRN